MVGHNAEGNYFNNHQLSANRAIGDIISCSIDLGLRRKRQVNIMNTMDFEMPADSQVTSLIEDCNNLYTTDELTLFGSTPQSIANILLPNYACPCTLLHAQMDSARFIPQDPNTLSQDPNTSPQCYVSVLPVSYQARLSGARLSLTQQCCYDDNSG